MFLKEPLNGYINRTGATKVCNRIRYKKSSFQPVFLKELIHDPTKWSKAREFKKSQKGAKRRAPLKSSIFSNIALLVGIIF